jgi:zinc transporter ZupT
MDPTLVILLAATGAAAMAALGAIPLVRRERLPLVELGWANALAAGLMLGAAYLLMTAGMTTAPVAGALGAAIGIAYVWFTHLAAGTEDLDLNRLDETGELYGYKVLLVNALHSATEGLAIGAAAAVDLRFGLFVALAMGVHNVPEAVALGAVLRSRGVSAGSTAALAVMTNVPQILLAVVGFAIGMAAPWALPWLLGFAVGGMIYLVMAELLPESYHQAGHTTIALVALLAMCTVVLLGGQVS